MSAAARPPADAAAVRRALAAVGLERASDRVDDAAFERLSAFVALRARWAGTHNLSGPRALAEAWRIDVADGVAVAAVTDPAVRLVDVGAGSGVPGMIVACLDPGRAVTLVEPIAKRTAFLRSAAQRLGLAAVAVVRGRWPEAVGELAGPAAVVSRAVVDPSAWPTLAVEGGAGVTSVVRMLAARRPPVALAGFTEGAAIDYALGADGERRVERWDRVG